ncbi:hypothetical protein QTP86_031442 [Hemibagrus guttatus]|nr:hypothetical protein QTP86_031442 [Hemibagrus guttatus]
MSESPRNLISANHAWSESRGELTEKKQPVSESPPVTGNRVTAKKKKKKRKQRQQAQESEKSSVSAPQLLCPEETLSVHGRNEKSGNGSEPIVRGIFQIGKKSHDVILTATRVTWTRIQPESPTGESSYKKPVEDFVELKDVFAVKVKRRRAAGQQSGGTLLGITLFFCKRKGAKLKDDTIHLDNLSVDHCEIWFKHLKGILNGFKHRPKSLKLFVNPISHKKEAYQIYKDRVAPLFKLADIQTDVTVTVRKGHALSILKECSLDEYDGVVCVGGDGSVAEVVQGLLLRAQMDTERDTHSAFTPVPAPLPLGVIPAGSANVVACSVHGVKHPVTAALHIILGKGRELADVMERRKVDILCVQETRWKGSKARSIGAGFKLFYYGVDSKRNGVGVVLKEEFVRNVLEVKRVSDRVMSLKLEIEGVMLNVVSGYAPQVGCELEEKERFWSELDEVMESIPTGERVVIGADFNGHVGEGNTGDEEVMGKFGVKERNLEGQMVVDFAKRMDMGVVNTYFQKREEHRVTYKSGGRRTQVVLPDDWETTAEVIRETGRKVLGVSSGRRKEDKETWWWNEEVQDSIQRKRLAKKKWDMDRTEENRQEYKELQRRVKREVSKAKQKAYDELYTRLDTREGEKDLYRLARQRDRDGKDVQQKVDKIRKDEVRKALKRMKSGKAVGPDDIPVEVWKCLGEAAVEFLANLFNRVLENLEKAYDRVPREELWYCMRKSGVAEKYVRVVQDMYERSRTVVRCAVVMDQLSEEVRQESPWTMMFADDIVICSESREQVEENLERWRFALERRGMKVSGIQSNGECGKEVKKRVQAETVSLRKRQESELEVAELKMLRFSLGVTRLDRIRNEYIRGTAHVGRLGDKVREARLRWFGHVQRRESHRQPVDVCSLSSMGVLQQFGFCVMVGFGGQALAVAERLNWIPPTQRHELALITALAQLRPEDCELSFIPSSTEKSDHTQSELEEDLSDVEDADWQVRRGLYLSLTITSIPCLCSVAPKGLAPFTRLNNNSMALTAVANTSRSEFIKHLKRYSSSNNPFSFSFVEVQRVRAVKLRPCSHRDNERRDSKHSPIIPSEGTLTWNVDGELLEAQGEVLIRVHPKLLELFGTDVEEAEEPPVNCSCI